MVIEQTFISRRQLLIEEFSKIEGNESQAIGKWNSVQTAQHCYKIEKAALDSILNFEGKRTTFGIKNLVNSILLLLFLRTNKKFKAPSKRIHPDETIDSEHLYLDWSNLDNTWNEVIEKFSSKKKLNIFLHPVAGKLNLKYTLLFILYHIEHHLRLLRK